MSKTNKKQKTMSKEEELKLPDEISKVQILKTNKL